MALIKCPECGKEISDSAMVCPNCGHKNTTRKSNPKALLIVLVGFFLVITTILFVTITQINKSNKQYVGGFKWGTARKEIESKIPEVKRYTNGNYYIENDNILDTGQSGVYFYDFENDTLVGCHILKVAYFAQDDPFPQTEFDNPEALYQKLEEMFGPPDSGKYVKLRSSEKGDHPTWILDNTVITFSINEISFDMR